MSIDTARARELIETTQRARAMGLNVVSIRPDEIRELRIVRWATPHPDGEVGAWALDLALAAHIERHQLDVTAPPIAAPVQAAFEHIERLIHEISVCHAESEEDA